MQSHWQVLSWAKNLKRSIVDCWFQQPTPNKRVLSQKCVSHTSSSDLHPSNHLWGQAPGKADQEASGVVEVWYNNPGNQAALVGHHAVRDESFLQSPVQVEVALAEQMAALADHTGGCDGRAQRHHWAGGPQPCTWPSHTLWKRRIREKIHSEIHW